MITRKCSRCKNEKLLDEFYSRKDGKPTWCKECSRMVAKARKHGHVIRVIKTPEEKMLMQGINRLYACISTNSISHRKRKNKNGTFINEMNAATLRQLFKTQEGKCFYTGLKMKLHSNLKKDPFLVSADRIDSTKDYVHGNVILCCLGMNWLKNTHTEEILMESLKSFYEAAKSNGKIK